MVKKAKNLKSLSKLNLSTRTSAFLERTTSSLEEIVWLGRYLAYSYADCQKHRETDGKAHQELVDALEKAGFIRKEINSRAFTINRFYKVTYGSNIDFTDLLCSMEDFYRLFVSDKDPSVPDFERMNEAYESFEVPSSSRFEYVNASLKSYLPEREYGVLAYRYGFIDGCNHNYAQTAKKYDITCERVRQMESRGFRIMRIGNKLPAVLASTDDQQEAVDAIIRELDEIHQNPIFQREIDLTNELYRISALPYDYANKAKRYFDESDCVGIEELNLNVRTYNRLKRAGIHTIADVIKFPKNKWSKMPNFGQKSMDEVEKQIHLAGYTDFSIRSASLS